jgi:hypothetical protein
MYYTIYKITNQVDGKIYIGSHKTVNLDDNYMGSGKYLKRAQEKYGLDNFTKEILFIFDNPEDMYTKEAEIVNEDFIALNNTYNLKVGGFGGWDYINNSSEFKANKSSAGKIGYKNSIQSLISKGYDHISKTPSTRNKFSEILKEKINKGTFQPASFKDKKHSEKTKKLIGTANSLNQKGSSNSQFGTRWIHSSEMKVSKKIKKEDDLPTGWSEGRKIKF